MVEGARKLLGAGALYTTATVAPILTVLAVTPVVTQMLGNEAYGQVAVAVSLYQVISVLLSFGLPAVITRDALLEESGFRGAAGLTVAGALLSILGGVAGIATAPVWTPIIFPGVSTPVVVFGLASGAGLAIVTLAQGILRAAEQVLTFVVIAGVAALMPPAAGLGLMALMGRDPSHYVAGLATGYAVAAVVALGAAFRVARPLLRTEVVFDALRVGLPTVPHGLAVPALLTIVIALVVRSEGLATAGMLQISVMLGSAVVTVLNAMNNAWAPMIFKSVPEHRARTLADSSVMMAALALLLVAGFVAIAPALVPFIGRTATGVSSPVSAANLVASSGAFAILYLANIHLTFIARRTWPLAIVTPVAATLAILTGSALALTSVDALVAWAAVWPTFYAIQALTSYLLARASPYAPARLWPAAPLTLVTLVTSFAGAAAVEPWWLSSIIGASALVLGCAWLLLWRRRRGRRQSS